MTDLAATKKDHELYDLCFNEDLDHSEESWNNIRRWVHDNKNNKDYVKNAATFRGMYNRTPLHMILRENPPLDIVEILLKTAPETLRMKDEHGWLPIHLACFKGASLEVVNLLIEAYPDSAKVRDDAGWLPIHDACCYASSLEVVNLLIQAFPESLNIQDDYGWLPIHRACWGKLSLEALNLLIQSNQESLEVSDIWHRTPSDILKLNIFSLYDNNYSGEDSSSYDETSLLHNVVAAGFSVHLVNLLAQTFPESCTIQDRYGMTPLHYACELDTTPEFVETVLALVNANPASCTVRDNLGRTPWQIFHKAASMKDMNGMLLLHHQAAYSTTLSRNSLDFFFSAYPESISVPDNHGLLPFHYACLNFSLSMDVLMLFVQLYPECIRLMDR